jgi:hypothetical protein
MPQVEVRINVPKTDLDQSANRLRAQNVFVMEWKLMV